MALLVKKVDWDDEKGSEGGDLGVDRVKDEISMIVLNFYLLVFLIFSLWVFEGFGVLG